MRVLGIHLASNPRDSSALAELEQNKIRTFTVRRDDEIIATFVRFSPDLVVFDSPLKPVEYEYRSAEKEMQSMNFTFHPMNNPEIQMLSKRGEKLKYLIENQLEVRSKVIETNIEVVKALLKINSVKDLQNVKFMNIVKNEFEQKAVISAIVGIFYLENNYTQYGDDIDGYVIVPKVDIS